MCSTCGNWARDGRDALTIDGARLLPNHHPHCPHYNDSLIDVFKVSDGSSSYYTTDSFLAAEELSMGEADDLRLSTEKMHREVFERLPEFRGF